MNAKLDQIWTKILDRIIADPELHGQWLETLSYLEMTGSRKISGFMPSQSCPLYILQHAAEESRHAFFFKHQIRKLGLEVDAERQILGGVCGKWLLHQIDQFVVRSLKASGLSGASLRHGAYLLTTLCIELRAEWLYPLYESRLRLHDIPVSLRAVIKEEEAHLDFVRQKMARSGLEPFVSSLSQFEAELFEKFTENMIRVTDDSKAIVAHRQPLGAPCYD